MATKQLRISDSHQIREQIGRFVGKKINIVLRDNTALFGVLKTADDHGIELVNMRRRTQRFALASIVEIYVDSVA